MLVALTRLLRHLKNGVVSGGGDYGKHYNYVSYAVNIFYLSYKVYKILTFSLPKIINT